MIEKLLLKLRLRDHVSAEEEEVLRAAIAETREVPADRTVIPEDVELQFSTLVVDGMMYRYRDLRNGSRQIAELHVSGDFADLHSFTLKRLDHSVMSITPCRIALVPHERLRRITEEQPHLTRLLWFSTNLNAAIHREWAVSLGRRSSAARAAHLFCELYERLRVVELVDGLSYELRLTQEELADCLGITAVHTNRTLAELRGAGLVEFRNGRVTILDHAGLKRHADFDPAYLYLRRIPQ